MPKSTADLTGRVFGRLTVLGRVPAPSTKNSRWECLCSCGKTVSVLRPSLVQGHGQSCGCLKSEATATRNYRHGHTHRRNISPTYNSWRAMMGRCRCPSDTAYPHYGERGIEVCERWHDFQNFLTDMGERPDGCELSRLDHDGDYEPGNVVWENKASNAREGAHRRWGTQVPTGWLEVAAPATGP